MRHLRHLLATLALLVAAGSAAADPPPPLKPGERWLVLASRQQASDAENLARTFGRDLTAVHVVKARNGWFAVVAGPYPGRDKSAVEANLPETVTIPHDAYLADNGGFQDLMFTAPRPAATLVVKYDGKGPITRQVGGLTLVLDSTQARGAMRVARLTGKAGTKVLFSTAFTDFPAPQPDTLLRAARLDPTTPDPQFVFSMYTGGAHCCTATRIIVQDSRGAWHVRDAGAVDGMGYGIEDVDGDGHAELLDVDNSFLYAFSSYAESWAPPVVFRLSGSQLREVTMDQAIRPYLRRQLREMELEATSNPSLWNSKGFLAGWVAAKAQLGQVNDAWPKVTALPDRPDLFSAEACTIKMSLKDCPADKRRTVPFAEALRSFLSHHDYPVPQLGNAARP